MAYLARYAHQPLSEIRRLTVSEVDAFIRAVSALVSREYPDK